MVMMRIPGLRLRSQPAFPGGMITGAPRRSMLSTTVAPWTITGIGTLLLKPIPAARADADIGQKRNTAMAARRSQHVDIMVLFTSCPLYYPISSTKRTLFCTQLAHGFVKLTL